MTIAEQFVTELMATAGSRSRIQADEVWAVFTHLRPDDARATDSRSRLARLIVQAEDQELLRPSTSTDGIPPVPLPLFVTLTRRRAPTTRSPVVPWLPPLAWASELRLSPPQLEVLHRVNRWLRDGGATRPVVPAEERSLQLFDDEKAIANRIGGALTLWRPDRLGPEMLRYENVPMPFPYREVGTGERLLMVENAAAFRSCARLLADSTRHPYYAVAFGQGAWAPKTVPSARDLPHPISAVDYWGDVDPNGLAITRDVLREVVTLGLSAQAHPTLWRLTLAHQPVPHTTSARSWESSILDSLPEDVRLRAEAVLTSRHRIPQERVGYEQLSSTPRWWDPDR